MILEQVLEWNERMEQMYLERAFEAGALGCIEAHDEILRWAEIARNRIELIESRMAVRS